MVTHFLCSIVDQAHTQPAYVHASLPLPFNSFSHHAWFVMNPTSLASEVFLRLVQVVRRRLIHTIGRFSILLRYNGSQFDLQRNTTGGNCARVSELSTGEATQCDAQYTSQYNRMCMSTSEDTHHTFTSHIKRLQVT